VEQARRPWRWPALETSGAERQQSVFGLWPGLAHEPRHREDTGPPLPAHPGLSPACSDPWQWRIPSVPPTPHPTASGNHLQPGLCRRPRSSGTQRPVSITIVTSWSSPSPPCPVANYRLQQPPDTSPPLHPQTGPPDPGTRWLLISPAPVSPAANPLPASEAGWTPPPARVSSRPPSTRLARHLAQPASLCCRTGKMASEGMGCKRSLPRHFGPCWQPWAFPGKIEIPKAGSPGLLEAEQRKICF